MHDRPIGYFFGEACHNLSLNERAKRSIRHSAEQGCLSGTGLGRTANQGISTDLSVNSPKGCSPADTRKEMAQAVGIGEQAVG